MPLEIKPGARAVFVDDALNCGGPFDRVACDSNKAALAGRECVVVIVQDVPGKRVGVYFREAVAHGHTLDGRVAAGHGAWVVADDLYAPEDHAEHKVASESWAAERSAADALVAAFEAP